MVSLRDSGKIVGSPVSIRQLAEDCGLPFPLSLRQFIEAPGCPFPRCNRLHLKVLTEPDIPIRTMVESMRQVYSTAGIRVEVASRETLSGPAFSALDDLEVDECDGDPTDEQNQLFANVNNVGQDEIVIYFVQSTVPALNGCAIHPDDQPGAVVAQVASQWTLAHEVGHVLDLGHISGEGDDCETPDFTRLMTGCSTSNITGTPTLSQDEMDTMADSDLTQDC